MKKIIGKKRAGRRGNTKIPGILTPHRRLGFNRTIAVIVDYNSVQLATGQKIFHLSRLIDVTKVYLPSSIKDEEVGRNFISNVISKYINKYGRPYTRYIIGVGGPETIFRTLKLPKMPKKELDRAILWEGKKRVPFDLNNACYGYNYSELNDESEGKFITASLIAVSRKEIDRVLGLLAPLNIKVDAIYLEKEAIGHLLPYLTDVTQGQTYALINIKRGSTEISYFSGAQLQFTHISSIGTESISTGGTPGAGYEQFTEALLTEVQNSLDFYAGQFSRHFNDKIYIYGDFSYSDDLIVKLSNNLGLEFRRFPAELWTGSWLVKDELIDHIPPVLGAVALAMTDYDQIDFLPKEIKEERAASRFYKFAVPALVILGAALLGFWASLKYQNDIVNFRLETARNQIEQFKNSESFRLYSQIKQQIALDKAFLDKLHHDPTFLHLNLKELSRITPEQIKLDMYDLVTSTDKPALFLSGRVKSTDPPPEIILAEFIARLENSPFFDGINIKRYTKQSHKGEFVLDFQIEMGAII